LRRARGRRGARKSSARIIDSILHQFVDALAHRVSRVR